MSNLLTRQEYSAIAEHIDYPRAAFIDGRYRPGNGASLFATNPATGDVISEIAACNGEDVEFAANKAREAFDQGHWRHLHPAQRKDVLIRLCKLMTRSCRELAVMESVESGKPIRDCEEIDVPEAINTIKWHAEAVDKIFDGVHRGDALAREEIFGPMLSVITVASVEEAIEVPNDTPYGLTASVFTANAKKAVRPARSVGAGTVTVNCYGEGDISTPFGGYKQSGVGGRDNGLHAHDQYTETKTIWVDLSDPAAGDNVA